jgi:hypothetical protein
VITARAPESASWYLSSPAFNIGLRQTMIPPSFQIASIAIGN